VTGRSDSERAAPAARFLLALFPFVNRLPSMSAPVHAISIGPGRNPAVQFLHAAVTAPFSLCDQHKSPADDVRLLRAIFCEINVCPKKRCFSKIREFWCGETTESASNLAALPLPFAILCTVLIQMAPAPADASNEKAKEKHEACNASGNVETLCSSLAGGSLGIGRGRRRQR
jgi:hypothetical protein